MKSNQVGTSACERECKGKGRSQWWAPTLGSEHTATKLGILVLGADIEETSPHGWL